MGPWALAALLLAGCGDDALSPSDVTGAWARADAPPTTAQGTLTSDSLVFFDREAPGPWRGMRRVSFRTASTGEDEARNEHFEFRVVGREVRITFDCPADGDCVAGPHLVGSVDGGVMTVSPGPLSSLATPYRRVSRARAARW